VGEGAGLLVRRALAAAGLDERQPGALDRFLAIYDGRLLNHTQLYPGVVEAVWRAKVCARVTVLTNKPLAPTLRILDALGLSGVFEEVAGGDGPLGRKPDPSGLLAQMAAAGTTGARTLLVGDSAFDRDAAARAGARSCLVSYGFGFHTVTADANPADWVVPDIPGLLRAIAEFAETSGMGREPRA
jgi:phosphoglycolate phosphatase